MKNLHDLTHRAREPSTYGGIAVLALLLGVNIEIEALEMGMNALATLAGIAAIFMKEPANKKLK